MHDVFGYEGKAMTCKEICRYCASYGDDDPMEDPLYYRKIEGVWYHGDYVCEASELRDEEAKP